MNAKVKKFLKWFIIILLVVGSVGATVFIFFKNYSENQIKEVDLVKVLYSNDKTKFDNGFDSVLTKLNTTDKSTWFEDAEVASANLDESIKVLTYYYVETDGKVKEKEISNAYSSMITTRNTLIDMFVEYEIKSTSQWFQPIVGANDIYIAYSNYLVKYAKLVKAVNENLADRSDFNTTSDIKFGMIDLYTRIVIDTFSTLKTAESLNIIENNANLEEIDKYFIFDHSYIDGENSFSLNALKFIEYYNACNKELFADNFVENLNSTTGYDETSSKEIKAAYYFNELFRKG